MPRHATFHDLEGRSVFITGGGSGIGAALTEGFLAQGARVAFVQRSDATPLVEELRSRHGRAPLFLPCDVTDIPALRAAMAAAAWSWVEKMLQDAQRTSAPRATRVSISTAVCTVMWIEPAMRAPARGLESA